MALSIVRASNSNKRSGSNRNTGRAVILALPVWEISSENEKGDEQEITNHPVRYRRIPDRVRLSILVPTERRREGVE